MGQGEEQGPSLILWWCSKQDLGFPTQEKTCFSSLSRDFMSFFYKLILEAWLDVIHLDDHPLRAEDCLWRGVVVKGLGWPAGL